MAAAGAAAGAPAATNGQAGGDANGGGVQHADAQNGQQEQAGLDGLSRQLGQVASGQEELRKFLASQPWGENGEAPDGDGELDLADFEGFDPREHEQPVSLGLDGDPEQLMAQLDAATGEAVQEAMAPVVQHVNSQLAEAHERIAEQRREAEAERLVGEFPEMADPETAQEVVNASGSTQRCSECRSLPRSLRSGGSCTRRAGRSMPPARRGPATPEQHTWRAAAGRTRAAARLIPLTGS